MKLSLHRYSTGTLYKIATQMAPTMMWGFFKRIYLNNIQGIPAHRPVLLAVNHPTAFVEPIVLCTYLETPIYNMTRGDIFKKPFFRKLMEEINMFPVYRVRDGYASRDRNDEVFEYCIDQLKHDRVVTIYVEGEHHLEKHAKPAQKGIARIAFAAFERHQDTDLCIIPIGCNYYKGDAPRDTIMVNVGKPIAVADYWPVYQQNAAQAINQVCQEIEHRLRALCYDIRDEADYLLAEQLLTLHRSDHPSPLVPVVLRNTAFFEGEKAVCDRLNALSESEKTVLREKCAAYFEALLQHGLEDSALANPRLVSLGWLPVFILLFPFAEAGRMGAWPVRQLAHGLSEKKVKKREFKSSVIIGAGFIGGWVYYLLLFLISLGTAQPLWIGLALLLPGLGWFSMFYRECFEEWFAARKALRHPQRQQLRGLREKL
jgi:glycerol-3-phosphate O-acyltransferase / dihydroxyacetone phosphate acyltransferase